MNWIGMRVLGLMVVAVIGVAACDGGGEQETAGGAQPEASSSDTGMDTDGMHHGMDMQSHAEEADSAAAALQAHIDEMRQLDPDGWYERMEEHVRQVSGVFALMDRQMREMDMGTGMDDDHMGEMMGMSGEDHARMMENIQALRDDLQTLQTASPDVLRERMPEHLNRLDELVATLEQSAEHMGAA